MPKVKIQIDGKDILAESGKSLLEACRENNIKIPTLCHFKGLGDVGACRLCVVEMEGTPKLLPTCTTPVAEGQKVKTVTEKLTKYRRMILELFFSERNHVCAICVANNNCELQDLGYELGMDHVRFPYLYQECKLDASHPFLVMDHNRCVMCTRCVRVCDEVEGAHHWDVMGRGVASRIVGDFNEPWGQSETCTSCGKCMQVCPTGAIWPKGAVIGTLAKDPQSVSDLVEKRKVP